MKWHKKTMFYRTNNTLVLAIIMNFALVEYQLFTAQ